MKLFDKVKNFFFEEEEYEDEIEEVNIKKKEIPKKKTIIKEEPKREINSEITERELFKAERTFNFPMDIDDDFVPAVNEEIKEPIKEEPKREIRQKRKTYTPPVIKEVEKQDAKKFRPTPIISPIYGIMEGEYIKPEEKNNDLSKTKEFSITKRVNFDDVRKKAYGTVKNEETEEGENKSIFFNLDDSEEEKSYVPDDLNENEDDIKITYNDVDYDNEDTDEDDDIEVPKIKRLRSKKQNQELDENEEDAILSETKEQDLFNLIDNMYNSEDEEEDE